MNKIDQPQDSLRHIRQIMERSSRFISLSGLSGVFAGLDALIGAALVYLYLGTYPFQDRIFFFEMLEAQKDNNPDPITFFALVGGLVLFSALFFGVLFTTRNAKRKNLPIWDQLTKRLLINLFIPLITGGVFIVGLLYRQLPGLIAPTTLIFYGLGLINASKYTLGEIKYLGLCEIALGLLALFFLGYGLEFWAIGFGILHIIYGTFMYLKYEKESNNNPA